MKKLDNIKENITSIQVHNLDTLEDNHFPKYADAIEHIKANGRKPESEHVCGDKLIILAG